MKKRLTKVFGFEPGPFSTIGIERCLVTVWNDRSIGRVFRDAKYNLIRFCNVSCFGVYMHKGNRVRYKRAPHDVEPYLNPIIWGKDLCLGSESVQSKRIKLNPFPDDCLPKGTNNFLEDMRIQMNRYKNYLSSNKTHYSEWL